MQGADRQQLHTIKELIEVYDKPTPSDAQTARVSAVYPIRYEWDRLGRIAAAGVLATLAGTVVVPAGTWPLWGILLRGSTVVAVFLGTLVLLGFFQPREVNRVRLIVRSLRQAGTARDRAAAKAAAEEGGTPHD